MTNGNPAKLIIRFTIPLLISNLFHQLYNMVDTLIVGRTLGLNALAAVGSCGSIVFLVLGFANGMTAGFSIIISQQFGSEDEQALRKSFFHSLVLSLAVAALFTGLSLTFAQKGLMLLRTQKELLADCVGYVRIIFGGILISVFSCLFTNVIRAMGDSKSTLYFNAAACLVNIVLDYTFIKGFGMGVEGAALATVISQLLVLILCVIYMLKKYPVLRLETKHCRFEIREAGIQLKLGSAMGLQNSIISVGAMLVQYALNGIGTTAIAAFSAAQKIEMIAHMPMVSLGTAVTTYVAQNYGAKKPDRIWKGVRQSACIGVLFGLIMGVVNTLFGGFFASFFIPGQAEAIAFAHRYLSISSKLYFVLAALYVYRSSLQGVGQSVIPSFAGIMELIMRATAAIVLSAKIGFTGICWANPLAWIGACVPCVIAYLVTKKWLTGEKTETAPGGADRREYERN